MEVGRGKEKGRCLPERIFVLLLHLEKLCNGIEGDGKEIERKYEKRKDLKRKSGCAVLQILFEIAMFEFDTMDYFANAAPHSHQTGHSS